MIEPAKEIVFRDYGFDLVLTVAKQRGGGVWVVVDVQDEVDEFTADEARAAAKLWVAAADECDRLNVSEPKSRRFRSKSTNPIYEWAIHRGGHISVTTIASGNDAGDSLYDENDLSDTDRFVEITGEEWK